MSIVTLEIENEKDLRLLLQLAERLGLKLIHKESLKRDDQDLSKHIAIIKKGIRMSENKRAAMLSSIENNRKDRQLPNR